MPGAPPQRAKRTYQRAAARKGHILEAALAVFAERGYHAASVADICERAAIGRATLYQYFSDKHDVLLALVEQIYERITERFAARTPVRFPADSSAPRPTREASVAFMQHRLLGVLQAVFDDAETTRLILRAARGVGGVVEGALQRLDAVILDAIAGELRGAIAASIVRPLDVELTARFMVGGLEKVVLSHLDEDRPLELEHLAREVTLLEAIGILTEPPSSPPSSGVDRNATPPSAASAADD
ncbi:MAG: TetR/AcrR family transcriptional regulator [Polyangiaceae bacterium]|nr:TetR/AcrR family transcriptional regulator [Polyangiaceae bacterium]MCW5791959.1 TetR/AcrR family transcriptional regulator [Polyangiaceae bacterium]